MSVGIARAAPPHWFYNPTREKVVVFSVAFLIESIGIAIIKHLGPLDCVVKVLKLDSN